MTTLWRLATGAPPASGWQAREPSRAGMDSRWLGSPRLQTTSRSTSKSSCTSPLKKPATARHGTSGSIALCPRLSRWLDHAADYNSRTSASCGNEGPKGIRSSRFVHRSAARDPAEDVLQEGQVGPKTCLHSTCVTLCVPARKAGCRQCSGTASTRRPRRFRTSTCTYLGGQARHSGRQGHWEVDIATFIHIVPRHGT